MNRGNLLLEQMQDEVKAADYRKAAETFCRVLREDEHPLKASIHVAIGAAAPYVQVPSHAVKRPTGELHYVNYDHTILGWRGAVRLMPHLSKERAMLPILQAMWYVPQGLNIYEQSICEFPGHYARRGCVGKFPDDPEGERFDGPTWTPPKIHFEDHEPLAPRSADEGFAHLVHAISEGDRATSYGVFLGLAQDPANHERLKEQALFAGIIDLQDTLINRGGYQNIGHKALRARAMVDLADYVGWDQARELIYTVIPDLGCSPRLYGLWIEVNNLAKVELSRLMPIPKRSGKTLTERELDELTDTLLWAGPLEVNHIISKLFHRGYGILDLTDGLAVGYQRYLMDVLEHPSAFSNPMHSFDYLNVVNAWIRKYDNPNQAKAVYMAARFINDAFRYNAMFPRDPAKELPPRSEYRPYADQIAVDRLLPVLLEAILAQDAPRACALVDSYLERTGERKDLMETITFAACHFQNDPHIMRTCASSIEAWTANQTSRRDDIIRGWVKHQSRYIKRAEVLEAFQLYERYFLAPSGAN